MRAATCAFGARAGNKEGVIDRALPALGDHRAPGKLPGQNGQHVNIEQARSIVDELYNPVRQGEA
jgi:hypothetical protein